MGYGCQHQECKVSAGMCCRWVCVQMLDVKIKDINSDKLKCASL